MIELFFVVIVCGILYFAPYIIAASRDSQYLSSIFVVNLFLGWTLVGWVACLAWALFPEKEDK